MTSKQSASIYNPATLAERWQCSERHIRNLCRTGELRSFRLGGKLIRIKGEDVEAFERRQQAIGGIPPEVRGA